jgi:hypothetical protein
LLTATCALNIEQRNTKTIVSPKIPNGPLPLGAPSSKTPKEQNATKTAACVENTILNRARKTGHHLAPETPTVTCNETFRTKLYFKNKTLSKFIKKNKNIYIIIDLH